MIETSPAWSIAEPKRRQAAIHDRRTTNGSPVKRVRVPSKARKPDRPGEVEMRPEGVKSQILVELEIEVDRQSETEIESHGAQCLGRMPVEKERFHPGAGSGGGAGHSTSPALASNVLAIGSIVPPRRRKEPFSVMIAVPVGLPGWRVAAVELASLKGGEIQIRLEANDPARIGTAIAERLVDAA